MQTLIANHTWNNFHWPEWVPEKVKKEIMDFHSDAWGRGPASWLDCSIRNKAPLLGSRVRITKVGSNETINGRYIHAWNNIGRLISDDGKIEVVGCHSFEISRNGIWQAPKPTDYSTEDNTINIGLWEYSLQTQTTGDNDNEN